MRRTRRRLEEKGPVTFRRITTADPEALRAFYEIERSGWKGAQSTAIICDPRVTSFYNEVAAAAGQGGYFSLYLLESASRPIAGHFGLNYRGRYFVPKAAFDEEYKFYGPGHLIIESILENLGSQGFVEFDFIGPWMEWKAKWTTHYRSHSWLYIFQKSAYGRLLRWLKFTARPWVKRLLGKTAVQDGSFERVKTVTEPNQ
jgi:CelD/BcsL family acetyltransferase involved in cellulose biosynthesis